MDEENDDELEIDEGTAGDDLAGPDAEQEEAGGSNEEES